MSIDSGRWRDPWNAAQRHRFRVQQPLPGGARASPSGIHGKHTVAKACALLEQRRGQRLIEISARFRTPIELGSRVELRLAEPTGAYQVWVGGKLAVEGHWR